MAKIGDTQPCIICGEEAILTMVRPPDVAAVGPGALMPELIPPFPGWECSRCGYVQTYNGPLDA